MAFGGRSSSDVIRQLQVLSQINEIKSDDDDGDKQVAEAPEPKPYVNPCQSKAERQAIRSTHKSWQRDVAQRQEIYADPSSQRVRHLMKRQEVVYERIYHTSEAMEDSKTVGVVVKAINKQVQRICSVELPSTQTFLNSFKRRFETDDKKIDWKAVGDDTSAFIVSVPRTDFMNGTFRSARPHKQRKVRQKKKIEDLTPALQPDQVSVSVL